MGSDQSLESQFRLGLAALQLDLDDGQIQTLLTYVALLQRWNRAYNLTAITAAQEMVARHLLDSLSVLPYLTGSRFVDVGSGAGLPGIPLAVARPGASVTLLDSNGKKTRFLMQAKTALGLNNIRVVQERAEKYRPPHRYDGVISRAFAATEEMVTVCAHLKTTQGYFYAMKGKHPTTELSVLPEPYKVVASYPLSVPGVAGERHLVVIN